MGQLVYLLETTKLGVRRSTGAIAKEWWVHS